MPRKLTLEFACALDQCEYRDHKCIDSDVVTGKAWVCPNLTATIEV